MSIVNINTAPAPAMISWLAPTSGFHTFGQAGTPASAAWPTANKAFFIPFAIESPALIQKAWVLNGATASGNFDIGLYNEDATKIYSSGSTAQSGTNTLQVITPTAFVLQPGRYYLALAMNGTTGTTFRQSLAALALTTMGMFIQTSAFALPATATFATASAETYVPIFGFATVPTI